jgi:hypothetical protein
LLFNHLDVILRLFFGPFKIFEGFSVGAGKKGNPWAVFLTFGYFIQSLISLGKSVICCSV